MLVRWSKLKHFRQKWCVEFVQLGRTACFSVARCGKLSNMLW